MDPESDIYKKCQKLFQDANKRQRLLKASLEQKEKKVQELEDERTQLQKQIGDLEKQLMAESDSRNQISRADLEKTLYEIRSEMESATQKVTQKIKESQNVSADSQMAFADASKLDLPNELLDSVNVEFSSTVDLPDWPEFEQYANNI